MLHVKDTKPFIVCEGYSENTHALNMQLILYLLTTNTTNNSNDLQIGAESLSPLDLWSFFAETHNLHHNEADRLNGQH